MSPTVAPPAAARHGGGEEIGTAVRQMAVYGIGNIVVKALGFFMLPFYTHYLTPSDYGVLEIIDLSITLFGLILDMGLTPAFLRCYATTDTPEEKRRLVATACIFGMTTGALTFASGWRFVPLATHLLLGKVPARFVMISFGALVLNYASNFPRTYLRALDRPGIFTSIDTAGVFLALLLNVVFIAFLRTGLVGVLWSSLIVAVCQFVLVTTWALWKAGIHFHEEHLRRMLRFGVPLILANIGLFVLNFSDRWFLMRFRSLDVVGVYAVGYKFGFMMNYLIVQPFLVMWQSRMYSIHAHSNGRNIFQDIFILYGAGLAYAGLAMSMFSREIVMVMTPSKFAASEDVIPVVALAYVFYGLGCYAQMGMYITERTAAIGVIGGAGAVLNLILNYFLIRHFGMLGAAWATAASFAFLAAFNYWRSQSVFPLPLGTPRVLALIAFAAFVYLGCREFGPASLWMSVAVKLAIVAAFPVAILKSGILTQGATEILMLGQARVLRAVRSFGA